MNLHTDPIRLVWCGNEDGTERVVSDGSVGWALYVPVALPADAFRRALAWSLKVQTDRWRGLPHSDQREALGRALGLLRRGMVQQVVVADKREPTPVFASTERTRPDRTIFVMGN